MRNGDVSFWWNQIGMPDARPALPGDAHVDVAIVGGGYTGLWTAYYLAAQNPKLNIAIIEQRFAGFGASGRNGGWLTNTITGGRDQYVREFGRDAVGAMQRAVNETVREVISVTQAESIDADVSLGGEYNVARNEAQQARLEAWAADEASWPFTDCVLLSRDEALERIAIERTTGAMWHPHAARIHPAKLARGLAEAVEKRGVTIYENTRARAIAPGQVQTDHGIVFADTIIRATEGFTPDIAGLHRAILPMNSSLIVTEVLHPHVWDAIGWGGNEVVADMAHSYFYAQRTADNRIAIGGRGVPYRYGSRLDNDGGTSARTVEQLQWLIGDLFPATAGVTIDHAWSGVLGVPRDWSAAVGFDPSTRIGWAGGYVGTGVTSTNLAARTLADLVAKHDSELTRMPWVNHHSASWEIEPLRWLAVRSIYGAYRWADRRENRGGAATSRMASIADWISGRRH